MKKQFLVANTVAVLMAALSVAACGSDDDGGVEIPGDGDGDGDGDEAGDGDGDMGGAAGDGDGDATVEPWVEGGRAMSGSWDGYIFTASEEGTTIGPEVLDGDEACVTGALGGSWEEWALVGWNIAQEIDEETFEGGAIGTAAPMADGVKVSITNNSGSSFRIQIQSDEDGTESWCAEVSSTGQDEITWDRFRKECWMSGGDVYDGTTEIAQVAVQIYSTSGDTPQDFDFCVDNLEPLNPQ